MKFIVSLFLVIILLSSGFSNSTFAKSANDGKYELLENRLKGVPTFCVLEPQNDPLIPDPVVPLMMKEMKNSIDVWTMPLKQHRQGIWDINYISVQKEKQSDFDKSRCDVIILFKSHDPDETKPRALRQHPVVGTQTHYYDLPNYSYYKQNNSFFIEIYYQAIGTCTENEYLSNDQWIQWDWDCRINGVTPMPILGAVMRHAIGHAFGFGHHQGELSSSIMRPLPKLQGFNVKTTPEQMYVSPMDLEKLKEIYNYEGWGAQSVIIKESPKKSDSNKKKTVDKNKLDKKRTDELKTKKDTKKIEKKTIKPKIKKSKSS